MLKYKFASLIVKLFYRPGYKKTFLLEDIADEEYIAHISMQMNKIWQE